jgi:hypothetical protein
MEAENNENYVSSQENGVYVLNEANFDQFLKNNPTAMVFFYAKW